jgi:hypothetical protein
VEKEIFSPTPQVHLIPNQKDVPQGSCSPDSAKGRLAVHIGSHPITSDEESRTAETSADHILLHFFVGFIEEPPASLLTNPLNLFLYHANSALIIRLSQLHQKEMRDMKTQVWVFSGKLVSRANIPFASIEATNITS